MTSFDIDDEYAGRFPVQVVGAEAVRRELWVPAEDLAEFNRQIVGAIIVEAAYYGEEFKGTALGIAITATAG